MTNVLAKSGKDRTGAEIRQFFSVVKVDSCVAVHTKTICFFSRLVRGLVIISKGLTNFL
jgi:hypothetical protein